MPTCTESVPASDRVELTAVSPSCGEIKVVVAPDEGGRVASLDVGELSLLAGKQSDGPLRWGCYPMVPWAGRLSDGTLNWRGQQHHFPPTMPPHAIHGLTLDKPWTVVDQTVRSALLRFELAPPWPFGGAVTQSIVLNPDSLHLQLEITAAGVEMPIACGWHPWFPRQLARGDTAQLTIAVEQMWQRGPDGLPTGELVPVPPGPWDDCFVAPPQPATISWPGALQLSIEADCTQVVVYDQEADALCVEPQTDPPNSLNTQPAVLQAGQTLGANFTIRWASPEHPERADGP